MPKKRYKSLLDLFPKFYKVVSYHNQKPDFYLKVGFLGKVEIMPKNGNSRLEKATKEEVYKGLEENQKINSISEERTNTAPVIEK